VNIRYSPDRVDIRERKGVRVLEKQGKLLKDCTITELESFAYQLLVRANDTQKKLQAVEQLIVQKKQEPKIPEVVEEKK